VVSFTLRPLYYLSKSPPCPSDRLGWPHNRSGGREEEKIVAFAGTGIPAFQSVASRCADRPARKADSLTAICESIVKTLLDPQHLISLWATTACYGDSFTLLYVDDVRTP
jgi:hypothetical protein